MGWTRIKSSVRQYVRILIALGKVLPSVGNSSGLQSCFSAEKLAAFLRYTNTLKLSSNTYRAKLTDIIKVFRFTMCAQN